MFVDRREGRRDDDWDGKGVAVVTGGDPGQANLAPVSGGEQGFVRGGSHVHSLAGWRGGPPHGIAQHPVAAERERVRLVEDDKVKCLVEPEHLMGCGHHDVRVEVTLLRSTPKSNDADAWQGGGDARGHLGHDIASWHGEQHPAAASKDTGDRPKAHLGLPRATYSVNETLASFVLGHEGFQELR